MKTKIIEGGGFSVVEFSEIPKNAKLYSEVDAFQSGSCEIVEKKFTLNGEKEEVAKPQGLLEAICLFWKMLIDDWKNTQKRKYVGEDKKYSLYEATEDDLFLRIKTSFPGTVFHWKIENGNIIAIPESFLVAETTVKTEAYRTGDTEIRQFSMTNDSFQKFTGTGNLFLEVHGGFVETRLKKGKSYKINPGQFLAMTEGVKLEMIGVDDMSLRAQRAQDYYIKVTAETDCIVWERSVVPKHFAKKCQCL